MPHAGGTATESPFVPATTAATVAASAVAIATAAASVTVVTFLALSSRALAAKPLPANAPTASLALPTGVVLVAQGSAFDGTGPAYKYQFPNGLKLLVVPDERNPVATLRLMLRAGSDREVPGRTGLAHFFEHMMFRKTRSRDEGNYDRTLSGIGGSGNASTSTDYVSYESVFPGPALDRMLDLEMERFRELDVRDPWFTIEKGAVISERKLRYENDPFARGQEILRRAIERGTPYEWLTIGLKADIETMRIEDARRFHEDNYTPDTTLVSVGGPFRPEIVVRKVFERFGGWTGKAKPAPLGFPADYLTRNAGKEFTCGEAVFEKRFTVVFPSDDASYEAASNLFVLNHLLATHPDGNLQRRLARKKLAVSFQLYKSSWQRTHQPYVASFRLAPNQNTGAAASFFRKALDEALERPVDDALRTALAKRLAVDDAEQSLRMTSLVQAYEWNEFFYGDFLASLRGRALVRSLNAGAFHAWVKKAFARERSFTYAVFPKDQAKPCETWEAPK